MGFCVIPDNALVRYYVFFRRYSYSYTLQVPLNVSDLFSAIRIKRICTTGFIIWRVLINLRGPGDVSEVPRINRINPTKKDKKKVFFFCPDAISLLYNTRWNCFERNDRIIFGRRKYLYWSKITCLYVRLYPVI